MAKNTSLLDISKILQEYSEEVQEGIVEIAEESAQNGVSVLKRWDDTYKIRPGKYNKGWRMKKEVGANYVHCTIHNATNYRLTHLLEFGHATRNGKRTRAFPHIFKVEALVNEEFKNGVEELLRKGGK